MNGVAHHYAVHNDDAGTASKHSTEMVISDAQSSSKLANGTYGTANGGATNGLHSQKLSNGDLKASNSPLSDLPPEIRHITENMFPFATLINRQAQTCWNGLYELVNELADMQMQSTPAQPNGINGQIAQQPSKSRGDQSEWNLQKKEKILKWAGEQRAFFTKLLVLSSWSRNAFQIHKAVDMLVWLREQLDYYNAACDRMGFMRRDLAYAQIPNPDLKTAAEVLATGRVASFPHLGYIKPKPLSARKVLKTFRHINTLLCSRLALHHEIPLGFQNYRVHDGRATFSVPSEFELDLSIADEDPESQFYFVAFRFLFTPCSNIPEGRLLDETAAKANEILRTDGLQGCYDLLHDLTLSYKVNILFKQALDMSRGQWSEQLRVELIHRTLVVQYWRNRASPKSWIEIGIKSGRRKENTTRAVGAGISFLDLRWIREGKEVDATEIEFNNNKLSMESTLRSVIALHASHLLESIYDKLIEHPLYAEGHLTLEASSSAYEPSDCYLSLQLTKSRTLTLKLEPITGNLVLQPASQGLMREEMGLNRSKNMVEDASNRLASLRCLIADQDMTVMAVSAGWEALASIKSPQVDVRNVFPRGTLKFSYFRLPSWNSQWTLALTHSMAGDNWWLMDSTSGQVDTQLLESQPIHYAASLSYSYFTALGEYVSNIIATRVNSKYVQAEGIRFTAENPSQFTGTVQPVEMQLDVPLHADVQDRRSQSGDAEQHQVFVKISGLDPASGNARFQANVKCAIPTEAQQLLATHGSSSLRSNFKNGVFVLEYLSPVTEPIIQNLLGDLRRLNRLFTYATILATQPNIVVAHISLTHLAIVYHQNPHARMLLKFVTGDSPNESSQSLVLTLNPDNPHERIKYHLYHILTNSLHSSMVNLRTLLHTLRITYPLLLVFSAVQSSPSTLSATTKSKARFHILSVSPTQYTMHFLSPSPPLDLCISHLHHNHRDLWTVRIAKVRQGDKQPISQESTDLKKKISDTIFKHDDSQGEVAKQSTLWKKMENGAVVDVMDSGAIESLLKSVLEVVAEATPDIQPGDNGDTTKKSGNGAEGQKPIKQEEQEVISID